MKNYSNYVYSKQIDVDVLEIQHSCDLMQKFLKEHFMNDLQHKDQEIVLTKLFNKYNMLMYPFPGLHDLYMQIKDTFYELATPTYPHFIQCWLNVYNKGQFIDWHKHWPAECNVWHGFYCADVESEFSYTSYKIPNKENIINIESENGLLVLGKSQDDVHRSSEWNSDHPRITIAFDIVPQQYAFTHCGVNHWIPI